MVKVACTVWGGGKAGDYFKGLPIAIKSSSSELAKMTLGFCITIHKSQGSEADLVVILCGKDQKISRKMIYTAITRAKKRCFVLGERQVFLNACFGENDECRSTGLLSILKKQN